MTGVCVCCSWQNRNTWAVLTYSWQHVNRKDSGPRAGPRRPCLRRESPAVTLRKVPAKPQARTETRLPLLGAAREDARPLPQHPGSQRSTTRTREEQALSSACPHKHRDRHGLAEVENTGTSRSVGTGSSPGFQGTTAQRGAQGAGSQPGHGLSPGSQGAAPTASCLSEQTQAQPRGWAQRGCRQLGHSAARWSEAHTTHDTAHVCFTLSTLQGDRPCTRHPNLWLHPT